MALTVADVIYLAMSECGAVRVNETPAPYELDLGMKVANIMLDRWSAENLMLRSIVSESFPLTAGTPAYTIGPTQAFATSKPIRIRQASITDTYDIATPCDVVSYDRWDSFPDKGISAARPIALYYDVGNAQGSTYGTINLYYTPDSYTPYTLNIWSDKYLTEFISTTAALTFEPAYYDAIVSNLAVRLFRHYHGPKVPVPMDMIERAKGAKSVVRTMNSRPLTASMDIPGKAIGIYNIYTGNVTEY